MQCPLCIDETLEPRFHGRVEIDVCPRCRGVWLDRGELEKLVEPTDQPVAARTARDADDLDRRRHDDDDDRPRSKKGKKKRKKSFGERLGDVFEDVLDFGFD